MRVAFNELAERELSDAAQYYELERPGLGAAFIGEVQRCTEAIVAHPDAAPIVTGLEIGQLGFSMGGHWAFWLAQQEKLPITATGTFYAARSGDYSQTRSSCLCHFAENDDWVSFTFATLAITPDGRHVA